MIKTKVITFDRKTGKIKSEIISSEDVKQITDDDYYNPMCKVVAEDCVKKLYPDVFRSKREVGQA